MQRLDGDGRQLGHHQVGHHDGQARHRARQRGVCGDDDDDDDNGKQQDHYRWGVVSAAGGGSAAPEGEPVLRKV